MSGGDERIVSLRLVPQRQGDRPASPSWAQKVEDWLVRHAVPFGTLQGTITVEYQHGHPVLIRLRVTATEEIIALDPAHEARRGGDHA
ncbi:MAG: hypothetical protein K6W08_12285 [Firmicutes bacterium]|nr:hypothetical protein [Bacillota bacterium]